jgi:hypothetical protein
MTLADRIALLLSLLAVLLSAFVSAQIYEGMPHLEDEIAYVWQARLIADGKLTIPTPQFESSFLVPFVVDYEGQRFGKYPLGWPAALGVGELLGLRNWVNPFLAGLAVWLIYRLGKKIFSEPVGLLAAGLLTTSPFFLVNTGSLLSHPLGLVLTAAFALFWFDVFDQTEPKNPKYEPLKIITAGLVFGLLVLTRPYTAVGVAVPFGIHGLYLLIRGERKMRVKLLTFGVIVLLVSALHFVWQYAVTGDPFLNPYTLWWEYDQVGFGPGYGRLESGHTLRQGWINTKFSLQVGYQDLFGWLRFSWIFLPFGVLALRRRWQGWMIASIFPVQLILYMAYWVGSSLYGPRYYFEGLVSLVIISALGISWLAGWPISNGETPARYAGIQRYRPLVMSALLLVLVVMNLVFYLPPRLQSMVELYGIGKFRQEPFLTEEAQALAPALFIVHTPRWMPYGALLDLQNPTLTTPFIFAIGIGPKTDAALAEAFPDRNIFHYYPENPGKFYTAPREP